jgi:glyoxylase-like metal-dependent hydrolase (beta-lactamase superfamily II)
VSNFVINIHFSGLCTQKDMTFLYSLNCAQLNPPIPAIQAATYCLVLDTQQGLALVDCGYSTQDFRNPPVIVRLFTWLMRTSRNPQTCTLNQLATHGINPSMVQHIILTHMHIDHAGGIADFPWATVHVHCQEYEAARHHRGRVGIGYVRKQWQQHQHWAFYENPDCEWFGWPAITLPFTPTILLIPTPGHTPGHCMVAIKQQSNRWLLQTGSAAFPFYLPAEQYPVHPPVWLQRWGMGGYVQRLKKLWIEHRDQITFTSGHEFVKRHHP